MKKRGSKVRLHGLRHSHATHMLASGIHPKISPPSAWGTARWGSRSISTAMFCRGCRKRRPSR
jgi:hypothetical protein